MADMIPLTFTNEQLIEALREAPLEVQNMIAVIAMQQELTARRAEDNEDDG